MAAATISTSPEPEVIALPLIVRFAVFNWSILLLASTKNRESKSVSFTSLEYFIVLLSLCTYPISTFCHFYQVLHLAMLVSRKGGYRKEEDVARLHIHAGGNDVC